MKVLKKFEGLNLDALLGTEFHSSDLRKTLTIRGYMVELLSTLWSEGEGFSGKRPFGNSGWEHDVVKALVVAGAVKGAISTDEYGSYLDDYDKDVYRLIEMLIRHMGKEPA